MFLLILAPPMEKRGRSTCPPIAYRFSCSVFLVLLRKLKLAAFTSDVK